ncbi:glycosyltransferase family 4 protein [Burkholderia ubonensis]|uniref:glycosyltransferase family 4 protein n=1 Tax=Burkholderia ubonensis TaxID=101571 RepID=UPI000757260E|nr:glycosyltransferase family 4 protein [Burkholderia ubonensis]KVD39639.1 glycosyl transferase [Burkholderia ubonensis]KVQ05617.1 glycosyl transferase [Burkholderia ubonensis]KVU85679.1 glycosyl transferase [Burkholderia ubonensis]KWB63502.1 glycosyl transferase [Burkholderia ubonensis]KWB68883.1 glycosyl transferase [Burkholderia ubonensis]
MRVLFATYPMAFHTPGGGEIQLLAYRDHLAQHDVEVSLFDPWKPRFLEHDLVHFFSCVGGSVHFCHFVKQLGLPLVISSSLWVTEDTRHLYPCDEIRHQLGLADRVVANSGIECDTLARVLNLPRNKFSSVLNGVDDVFFEPVPAEQFRDAFGLHVPFVLNVGNIEPRKNQLALIRAMKQMPELKIVFIGHERDPAYAQACRDASGDQALYLGPLEHHSPMLRSAYAACDVFCLPSTLETPGLAALEAYALGTRIAITEVGSTREYFGDTPNVHFLRPDNVESIAAAVRAARASDCAAIVPAMSREHRLSWHQITKSLKDIYSTFLNNQ